MCGDGLTPRAIAALNELKIDYSVAHRIDGLRMIAGKKQRELQWPSTARFPNHGAVWPRQRFDNHLLDEAIATGADVRFDAEALPELEGDRVVGVRVGAEVIRASLVVLATGAQGAAAKCLEQYATPMKHLAWQFAHMRQHHVMQSVTSKHVSVCATNTEHLCQVTDGCFQQAMEP